MAEVRKRIVRRRRGGRTLFCVLAETTDRSFGCYTTRAQAERRLRQIERFKNQDDADMTTKKDDISKAAHVHTFGIGDAAVVTSSADGDPHSHTVALPGGGRATTSRVDSGPGHNHVIVVEGRTLTSSGPKDETARAKGKARRKRKEPAAKSLLPRVLDPETVCDPLPDEGSGLPPSLEADVPPEYRYWLCEKAEDAALVREALVEAALFTGDTVLEVNGQLRRVVKEVVEKTYLPIVSTEGAVVVPDEREPIEKFAQYVDDDAAFIDAALLEIIGLDTAVGKVAKAARPIVVEAPADVEHVNALRAVADVYRVLNAPGRVFAATCEVAGSPLVKRIATSIDSTVVNKYFGQEREMRILVKQDAEEERIVYGIVLEPDQVDKQNDTITEGEIRQAAHKFMEEYGTLGLQHDEVITGRAKILETFIAPVDFTVGEGTVRKGSWVMAERLDKDLFAKAKAGKLTGFSIGGRGNRVPVR